MSKNKLFEIKNLKTYFYTEAGTVKAVNDISFDIYKNETLGIVGESGSGKSVTSLSINRLIPNPPGEIVSGEMRVWQPKEKNLELETEMLLSLMVFLGSDESSASKKIHDTDELDSYMEITFPDYDNPIVIFYKGAKQIRLFDGTGYNQYHAEELQLLLDK